MEKDDAARYVVSYDLMDRRRAKDFHKRHPNELASCLKTLEEAAKFLNDGLVLGTFRTGLIRSEGGDLWRIGPRGARQGRAEIRLYFWFFLRGKTLYALTVGDKKTQPKDITSCKQRIAEAVVP